MLESKPLLCQAVSQGSKAGNTRTLSNVWCLDNVWTMARCAKRGSSRQSCIQYQAKDQGRFAEGTSSVTYVMLCNPV